MQNEKEIEESNLTESHEEMTFMDHLEDLRKRILYAVLSIILGCIVAGIFIDEIMLGFLLKPAKDAGLALQNLRTMGQAFLYFKVVLWAGFVISFPLIIFQIWKFVEPALYNNEKGWARSITFFTSLCFLMGVSFAYFVMIPSMLYFAANFGTELIKNEIDVNDYWSFITTMMIAAGIFFELPMLSFVLSKAGLLAPGFLRKYRRYSVVIILVVAAIVTPTPDPVNQMIVAVPIYILYEISIVISAIAIRSKVKKAKEENEDN